MKTKIRSLILFIMCFGINMYGQNMAEVVKKDRDRGIILPLSDGHYQRTKDYVEDEIDLDYCHASEAAHEAFRDTKFSIRIHWGIYSIWQMDGESWGFLDLPNEKKQEYNSLYKTFNPEGFDAKEWMSFFRNSGVQAMTFTTKHHDGFSMFDTQTHVKQRVRYLDSIHPVESCDLAYSIMETPFKRDIVRELCEAARDSSIRIGLYYSHPDWYDADFRPYNYHPISTLDIKDNPEDYGHGYVNDRKTIMMREPTAEETNRMVSRHREQMRELLTNYGKIDMICLDQWLGENVWPQTKETIKMMRRLQPETMMRARGIGNYGDYYTPENFVPGNKENTNMPWMTIYPLGASFSYDKDSKNYKGPLWIIHNIIDCAAKGGSFMVGIGPDDNGLFHPTALEQLKETGRWLKVNGLGIYGTRSCDVWQEHGIYFTRTKDQNTIFAFVEKWPDKELVIPSVRPKANSKLYLLGHDRPLEWSLTEEGVNIKISEELQSAEKRPCKYAWGFQINIK